MTQHEILAWSRGICVVALHRACATVCSFRWIRVRDCSIASVWVCPSARVSYRLCGSCHVLICPHHVCVMSLHHVDESGESSGQTDAAEVCTQVIFQRNEKSPLTRRFALRRKEPFTVKVSQYTSSMYLQLKLFQSRLQQRTAAVSFRRQSLKGS